MELQSTPLTFKRFSYYKGKIMFLNIQILVRNVHRRLYERESRRLRLQIIGRIPVVV